MTFTPPLRSLGARVLPILVVVDVDPDWRAPGGSGVPYRGGVSWHGLREGVPRLLELTKHLRDDFGQPIRFTWLVRSDEQMAALSGDTAFVATAFESFWRERLAAGDEVGWHPHLWRYSERHRLWYQETRDVDWMTSCLRDGHAALARHFRILAAKSGWTFHTNDTLSGEVVPSSKSRTGRSRQVASVTFAGRSTVGLRGTSRTSRNIHYWLATAFQSPRVQCHFFATSIRRNYWVSRACSTPIMCSGTSSVFSAHAEKGGCRPG